MQLALSAQLTWASESQLDDEVVPYDVKGITGSLTDGFKFKTLREVLKEKLEKDVEGISPFIRDASLDLHFRTYLFERKRIDDTRNEAVAVGGSIEYQTGKWKDFLSIGSEVFTSQKIEGDPDKDGTLLLKTGQRGYTVLGTAYLKLSGEHLEATLYRQKYRLPYVNIQDSRMTPNTFEGYSITGDYDRVDFIAGHIHQMKKRNETKFIDIALAAGASEESDKGLTMVGARINVTDDFLVGAINQTAWDVMNIAYAETEYQRTLLDDLNFKALGQFTHQKSIGDELLGDPFETHVYGGKVALSYQGVIFTGAFSVTDEDSNIRSPFGSYPGFISLMQKDFNRAGEEAWLIGLSSDFQNLGLDGFSGFINYASGKNAVDSAGSDLNDQNEFNVTLDYRFQDGLLKNFWIRARASFLEEETPAGDITGHDYRIIINYTYSLF